jgi:ketosteroid isomerase-like protein
MQTGPPERDELIAVTQRLLESIASKDWKTYEALCDPSLTCFEPEARGHLVEGMPFHRFYFDGPSQGATRQTTICSPNVRMMGDVAVVAYNRLTQSTDSNGQFQTSVTEETRVWHRQGTGWRLVHFHRS